MKIRTDFVTNSSSSSFVAWLQLSFDNGKELRLLGKDSHNGGEEGGFIVNPETHYEIGNAIDGSLLRKVAQGEMDIQKLIEFIQRSLKNKFEEKMLFLKEKEDIFDGATKIASGKLTLWAHTYGEYYSEADPKDLLEDNDIFESMEPEDEDDYNSVYQALRNHPDAHLYTDKALQRIAKALTQSFDKHGSDTEVIQRLTSDGMIDVDIRTNDDAIIPVKDAWDYGMMLSRRGDAKYDIAKRMKKYGLTKESIWNEAKALYKKYKACINDTDPVVFEGRKFCLIQVHIYESELSICKLGGECTNTLDGSLDYLVYGIENDEDIESIARIYDELAAGIALCEQYPSVKIISLKKFEEEIELQGKRLKQQLYNTVIDAGAPIVFRGKHFLFDCINHSWGSEKNEEKYIKAIESAGGIIHDNPIKGADYLVIGSNLAWKLSRKIENMLEWRKKGSKVKIVLLDDVKKVLADPALQQEMQIRYEEEVRLQQEQAIQAEEERKRLIAEEKQKKLEEKRKQKEEEARKAAEMKAEAERQREYEREYQRLQQKQEKEQAAAEAKAKKEAERAEALANAKILYAPGQEPEKLHARIETLLAKLEGAYPDRVIVGLHKDHKKWGEAVTELYRLLGYPDNRAFLEAYGFTMGQDTGGHPTTTDPEAIIEELKRRYPEGSAAQSMDELKTNNPDIPWKTLSNNARDYFGETLAKHLRSIGILK